MNYLTFTHNYNIRKKRAFLTQWELLTESYNSGNDITSLITHLKAVHGKILVYDLNEFFPFIHLFLLENGVKYRLTEQKNYYYIVKLWGLEIQGLSNYFPNTDSADIIREYGSADLTGAAQLRFIYESFICTVKSILYHNNISDKCLQKITISGMAFEIFKELSEYKELCPRLSESQFSRFSRAYYSGYIYARKGTFGDVRQIDRISAYPSTYATDYLPIGKPIFCESENELKNYRFYIIHISAVFALKPGYLPIIQDPAQRGTSLFLAQSNDEIELTLSNYDFEKIKEYYNIDYKFMWGAGWLTKKNFFKRYADLFIEIKERSTGLKREIAKYFLNTPYGKLGQRNEIEERQYTLENGEIKTKIFHVKTSVRRTEYLPMAIAITAKVRYDLLSQMEKIGFSNVLYSDTDCIKGYFEKSQIELTPHKLGAWKDEGDAMALKILSAKRYATIQEVNGQYKLDIKCAGISKKAIAETFNTHELHNEKAALELLKKFDYGFSIGVRETRKATYGIRTETVYKTIKEPS